MGQLNKLECGQKMEVSFHKREFIPVGELNAEALWRRFEEDEERAGNRWGAVGNPPGEQPSIYSLKDIE